MATLPSYLQHLAPAEQAAALRAAARAMKPVRLRYCPITPTPKQEAFLRLVDREVFFGGAAGPGKSAALLAAALQYADVPGYHALLLRRTYPELAMPGALMEMAQSWLSGTDARWNSTDKTWTFRSGATLTFGYLQTPTDKHRYQGASFNFIGFDELTGFRENDYTYMLSRCRRRKYNYQGTSADGVGVADIPLRIRSASNPGNVGHDWVKRRFVDAASRTPGVRFLPALIRENPHLDVETYIENLMHLGAIDRQRLLDGDWDVREDGTMFRGEWFVFADSLPDRLTARTNQPFRVRHWDLAATEPGPAAPDPDWTAGVRWAYDKPTGEAYVEDIVHIRKNAGEVERTVERTAHADGRGCWQVFEQEPGSSGKALVAHYAKKLRGYVVKGHRPTGPKEARAVILAAAMENGAAGLAPPVYWLPCAELTAAISELVGFPNASHDDIVDACSGGYAYVTKPTRGRANVAQGRLPRR